LVSGTGNILVRGERGKGAASSPESLLDISGNPEISNLSKGVASFDLVNDWLAGHLLFNPKIPELGFSR
jgi:hypothetical protein